MKGNPMKAFELNPQVRRFTEPKDYKQLHVIIQNSRSVVCQIKGLEPMLFMYLWNNMTKAQFALVFDDKTKRLFGYIKKNEHGIPQRYEEPEELYFKDMYEIK